MAKLSDAELQQAMAHLPNWQNSGGTLQRTYRFDDFVAAMAFVNQLAAMAEQAGHHPDIDIRYNQVKVALVTHSEGGITRKDTEMASRISAMPQ